MNRIFQIALLAPLRGYKWALSPMFPPACRYVPTCSEYAVEAIERHGAIRGSVMAMMRLLRCHPFTKGGFDPVPHSPCGDGRPRELALSEVEGSGGAKLHFDHLTQRFPRGAAH